MTRELLTIEEACARIKVTRRSIYNWIEQGKLRLGEDYVRTAGGAIRIYADRLIITDPEAAWSVSSSRRSASGSRSSASSASLPSSVSTT